MLLIDEPNESYKNSKTFERNTLSSKKKPLKRKENITPAKTNAPISQTSSECLKLTIQTYRMRNKKNLRGNIKSILPVRADLSNDFKSIIFKTDQIKISPFMRLFWEEQ